MSLFSFIYMNKYFLNGIKQGLGFIFILSFFSVVFAVGFHTADDVLSGNFIGDFTFGGSVQKGGLELTANTGFKNLVINGDLRLNQRSYTNLAVLNSYTYDRFKTIGSSSIAIGGVVSGSVVQFIENGDGYLEGLNLTVSNGVTGISGISIEEYDGTLITLDGDTFTVPVGASHIKIILSNTKIDNLQVEVGNYASPFELRPRGFELQLAQRYYESGFVNAEGKANGANKGYHYDNYNFKVTKRVIPVTILFDVSLQGLNPLSQSPRLDGIGVTGLWNSAFDHTYFRASFTSDSEIY